MPTLSKARRLAKTTACQSNLKQLGLFFSMYANDNSSSTPTISNEWLEVLPPHHNNSESLSCCPMATKPVDEGGRHPFAAFSGSRGSWLRPPSSPDSHESIYGSFGINGWVCNPPQEVTTNDFGLPTANNWRSTNIKGSSNIPLLLDSMWIDSYPDTTNIPPSFNGDFYGHGSMGNRQIRMFCINRHEGFTNCAFLDFSIRKAGLKELWKLKWHRNTDINAPTPDWPDWMRKLKDY